MGWKLRGTCIAGFFGCRLRVETCSELQLRWRLMLPRMGMMRARQPRATSASSISTRWGHVRTVEARWKHALSLIDRALCASGSVLHASSVHTLRNSVSVLQTFIDAYGAVDTQLWLDLARYHRSRGQGTGPTYWRAVKVLTHPEEFVTACQLENLSASS